MIEAEPRVGETAVRCGHCGGRVTVPGTGLKSGAVIGGFRIERRIGRGGMGEVFLATQLSLKRRVALKVLPPELASAPDRVERFLREVRMLGAIEHPRLVTAFEAGEDSGIHYLAMAYVDGETVADKVRRNGPLPEREALRIVGEVARALEYAWGRHRLLHRDIKPGNIMLDRFRQVYLLDLGLARRLAESTDLTLSGRTLGTPAFMSPEQVRSPRAVDFRSDIYALGATLYYLIVGRPPFNGNTPLEIIQQHLSAPAPSPREFNPEISKGCEHLLEVMLAKQPSLRQASWGALVADVNRVLEGRRPHTPRPGFGMWRRRTEAAADMVRSVLFPRSREGKLVRLAALIVLVLGCVASSLFIVLRRRVDGRLPAPEADHAPTFVQTASSARPAPSRGAAPTAVPVFEAVARAPTPPPSVVDVEKRVRVALEQIKLRNPMLQTLNSRFRKTDAGAVLDLMDNPALRDISALRGLPLVELELGLTPISDLSPLKDMPLKKLGLRRTQVVDLSPIAACPIETLDLTGTPITDLWPLEKMPLKELRLEECSALNDLSPLSQCWLLERLIIPAHCRKIANLRDLPDLKFLNTAWDDWKLTAAEFWREHDAAHPTNAASPAPPAGPGLSQARIRQARRALDALADTAAGLLLAGRTAEAMQQVEKKRAGSQFAPIEEDCKLLFAQVKTAATAKTLLMQSFREDLGKEITVQFRNGARRLRVRKVSGDWLDTLVPVRSGRTHGVVQQRFRMTELALNEISRRLENEAPGAASVAAGLAALARNNTDRARKEFARSGPLGKALESRLDDLISKRKIAQREERAAIELQSLLRTFGLPPMTAGPDEIRENLDRQEFSKGTVKLIRERVGRYRQKFGDTSIAKGFASVLDALLTIRFREPKPPGGTQWKHTNPRTTLVRKVIRELQRVNHLEYDLKYTFSIDHAKKLITLNLAGNKGLVEIAPLRKLPLKSLNIERTGVKDLTALAGMPLVRLLADQIAITDLAPLAGMPLQFLVIGGTGVSDLSPLSGAPLKTLDIAGTPVTSLAPLKKAHLTFLSIWSCTGIDDLSPLRGQPLEVLYAQYTPICDLAPLSGMPLRALHISGATHVSDIHVLRGMTTLRELSIGGTGVKDFSPLAGLQLRMLHVDGSAFSDADLRFLHGMGLQNLDLRRCSNIHDLTPLLEFSNLQELRIPKQITETTILRRRLKHLKFISY